MTGHQRTILGISAFYHDSAAALLVGGEIVAAAQEERFSRTKNDAGFPEAAIRYCLEEAGIGVEALDAVAFYEKPFLKFERLLETYYAYSPKGLVSFLQAMPVWLNGKLFLRRMLTRGLAGIGGVKAFKAPLLFPAHHLSHAASGFYSSNFERAAILTIDGVGEKATACIFHGKGKDLTLLREMSFPHSIGLFYSAVTYYCGFKVNEGEYKLMGLAPYGREGSAEVERYTDIILTKLMQVQDDGSVYMDPRYYSYATGLRMVPDRRWEALLGIPRREPESAIHQSYCDLALAAQRVTEAAVYKMAAEARRLTGERYLCIAGGVGLNGVANGKIESAGLFDKIFVQPAAGDAGGALGAAQAAEHIYFGGERLVSAGRVDQMKGAFLGPSYGRGEILAVALKHGASYAEESDEDLLLRKVAGLIASGKVVGWFQGRMEFGPRALGARSILADARDPSMQKNLNLKIKFRESFRPFAPIVPIEHVSTYFDQQEASPYMLMVKQVRTGELPATTHVDGSARVQTVHRETNARLWKLLEAFRLETGVPVMVNTSFNVRDEPIVNSPEDAYHCFMRTGMDYLVMDNFIFDKL